MPVTLVQLPGLGKGEFGFKADSGRYVKVTVHKVVNYAAPGLKEAGVVPNVDCPQDYHLVYTPYLVNADGTPVLEGIPTPMYKKTDGTFTADGLIPGLEIDKATGDPVVDHVDTTTNTRPVKGDFTPRPISASGIANGQESLADHWKLWHNVDAPRVDQQPPPGLVPTNTGSPVVDKDGNRWWCWRGHPDASPMDAQAQRGDFYLDADSTLKYRVRASVLEFHASDCAAMYDAMLTAHSEPENLGLPTI